jgi:tetratricopeptide (TPR) repeat protein
MSIIRIFRLGIKVAAWATPRVKEWHAAKHFNRTEGDRHFKARNYAEAETHLVAALQEKHSPAHRVEMLAQLASAQRKQNKLAFAAESARQAMEIARQIGDPDALWKAAESLVEIQMAHNDTAAAIQTLEYAENTEKHRSSPDATKLAQSARQRGKLLLQVGRPEDALAALEFAVEFSERAWGPDHAETAHGHSALGILYQKHGQQAKAQEHLQKAMKVYRASAGFDTPEASQGLQNLAISLEESGDIAGATAEYERYLANHDRQLGANRAELAQIQVRLAALYIQAGRSSAARELLMLAIGVLERTPGQNLRDALEIMAVAEDESGRPKEAEIYRQRAERVVVPAS